MSNKLFSERLNNELDIIGVPSRNEQRIDAFAKLVKIPRFKAECLLTGKTMPESTLLSVLAQELEVSVAWLTGESDHRQH